VETMIENLQLADTEEGIKAFLEKRKPNFPSNKPKKN